MKIYKCDLCGKEFDEFDKQEGFGLHYDSIGYGSKYDGETIDVDMCCDCFDKMIDDYIIPQTNRSEISLTQSMDNFSPENGWNYDLDSCPLDTKVYLLSKDDFPILPQQVFVGTVAYRGSFRRKGECFSGNPDYFYRSEMVAWKPYNNG